MWASRLLGVFSENAAGCFALGFFVGVGMEVFKMYFSFMGVSYHKVLIDKQLPKRLQKFEQKLINREKELQKMIDLFLPDQVVILIIRHQYPVCLDLVSIAEKIQLLQVSA